ncbi:calcium-binding protein [Novosphingobium sp.]|uniref:calcium-binding protein n=1 Tax=Novosphingobium sp. TaxID=1874826 RepID=UPI00260D770B|nr:calcium-binding protein [Novosphingobium sp.]
MANLVNNLGGPSGFGENALASGEDNSGYIDLTSTIPGGLSYFGKPVTGMIVWADGMVSLIDDSKKLGTYVASIAPLQTYVDDTPSAHTASAGGTSTGSGRVFWDLNPVTHRVTITWDDVQSNDPSVTGSDAFQLTLSDKSGLTGTKGDFDIVVRYEAVEWLSSDSVYAAIRVPYRYQLGHEGPESSHSMIWADYGDTKALLGLPTASNIGVPGVFNYQVRNAQPTDLAVAIDPLSQGYDLHVQTKDGGSYATYFKGVLEGTGQTTPLHFTVTRNGPLDGALEVNWAINTDGPYRSVDVSDFVGGALSGVVHFAAGEATTELIIQIAGDAVSEGNEVIDITFSNESILASVRNTVVVMDDEDMVLQGTDAPDYLGGAAGNDTISGKGGYDILDGGPGNDILEGGDDNDFVNGGPGRDTASYEDSSAAVYVNLLIKESSLQYTGGAGNDYLRSIENLTGSAFNDTLFGDLAANVLTGLAGDDKLDGRGGGDTLIGGKGNDKFYIRDGGDSVIEQAGEGADRMLAHVSATIAANVERLDLLGTAAINGKGNAAANLIFGNQADNVLSGGGGADRLTGRGGNDTFVFPATGAGIKPVIISDFTSGSDHLSIEVDAGSLLGSHAGTALTDAELRLGSRAQTADQHLVYNAITGALFYDPDGVGGQAQIKIAILLGHPDLHASDIGVIAL